MAITKTGIRVDTDPYFSDPLVFEEDGAATSIRATGLKPNTTYHVMGYVIEDGTKIFSKNTKTFDTISGTNYFTLTNTSNGQNTITITKHEDAYRPSGTPAIYNITLSYTTDDGVTWNAWNSANGDFRLVLESGESVKFKGNNTPSAGTTSEQYYNFGSTANCSISGDLNTLINETGGDIEIPALGTFFQSMFMNMQYMENAGIILPTTSGRINYFRMFEGCSSMTTVPSLPATGQFAIDYGRMFKDCTAIVRVPENLLPVNRVPSDYYTIKPRYGSMFEGCTSLENAPALPSTGLSTLGYSRMFYGCSALQTAPVLPATTLVMDCYYCMFYGCSSLNEVTTYAEDISATDCTTDWLKNVSNSGTFNNYGKAAFTTDSASGIPVGWTENKYDYFHITSLVEAPNAISLSKNGSLADITLEYSTDKENWTEWTSANGDLRLIINEGETVWFRGNNSTFNGESNHYKFSAFFDIAVGGNCMSLLDKTMQQSTVPSYAFAHLFSGCTTLKQISDILPATSLGALCYMSMFQGCTGLTSLPSGLLPATSFNGYISCYRSMFQGCTGLTSLPSGLLPVTSLESQCYASMFKGCTGLTSLPSNLLPATTLESQCYANMFQGCTGLTSLPSGLLPATTLSDYCYDGMFRDCTGLTSLPSGLLPATSLSMYCYQNMFYGCTSITEIELPAPTPYYGCYNNMLRGCSSLNKIICYTADLSSSYSSNWVNGAGNGAGDFYNLSGSTIPTGNNGIPTGWTEHTSL